MTIQHADRVQAELVTEDPRFQEATYFVNTFFFARLNGHLVGFYNSERLLADMKLIEAWLDKTPAGKQNNTCNALNFGSCVQACA